MINTNNLPIVEIEYSEGFIFFDGDPSEPDFIPNTLRSLLVPSHGDIDTLLEPINTTAYSDEGGIIEVEQYQWYRQHVSTGVLYLVTPTQKSKVDEKPVSQLRNYRQYIDLGTDCGLDLDNI